MILLKQNIGERGARSGLPRRKAVISEKKVLDLPIISSEESTRKCGAEEMRADQGKTSFVGGRRLNRPSLENDAIFYYPVEAWLGGGRSSKTAVREAIFFNCFSRKVLRQRRLIWEL
jgi:hypothetical protein